MAWTLVCKAPNWALIAVQTFMGFVPAGSRIKIVVDHYIPVAWLGDLAGAEWWQARLHPALRQFGSEIEDVYGTGIGTIVVIMKVGNNTTLNTFFKIVGTVLATFYTFPVKEIRIFAERVEQETNGNGGEKPSIPFWLIGLLALTAISLVWAITRE